MKFFTFGLLIFFSALSFAVAQECSNGVCRVRQAPVRLVQRVVTSEPREGSAAACHGTVIERRVVIQRRTRRSFLGEWIKQRAGRRTLARRCAG